MYKPNKISFFNFKVILHRMYKQKKTPLPGWLYDGFVVQ
jgi:hypothetical protein